MRAGAVLCVALLAAAPASAHAAGSAEVAALQVALRGRRPVRADDRRVGRARHARGRAPLPGPQRPDGRRGGGCRRPGRARAARRAVVRKPHAQPRRRRAGTWRRSSSGSPGTAFRRAPSTAASAATWRRRCGASRRIREWRRTARPGPQTLRLLRGAIPRSPIWLKDPVARRVSATASGRAGTASTPASTTRPQRARSSRLPGRGQVVFAGWDTSGYGNTVVIEHPLGVRSLYAHLSRIGVNRGTAVVGGLDGGPRRLHGRRRPARTCTSRCACAARRSTR